MLCIFMWDFVCPLYLVWRQGLNKGWVSVMISRFELVPLQGFCGNSPPISVIILNGRRLSWLQFVDVGVGLFRTKFCVLFLSDRGLVQKSLKWRSEACAALKDKVFRLNLVQIAYKSSVLQ